VSSGIFEDRPTEFSSMFQRVLSMMLDRTLSISVRTHLLCFLIQSFQSLDCTIVRKECAPLVSINIWHNLSADKLRDVQFERTPHLKKLWRAISKRYGASDDAGKSKLRFERSWLYTLVLQFLTMLYDEDTGDGEFLISREPQMNAYLLSTAQRLYCERFAEFVTDLQSQLPTRRYVNTLLRDLHILPIMKLSPMYNDEDNGLLRDLHALLSHYTFFTIDDQTGIQATSTEAYDKHCSLLGRLQIVALKHFKDKLMVLALSNYGGIDTREELEPLLEPLDDAELKELAELMDFRTSYPESFAIPIHRKLLLEILLTAFQRKNTFREVAQNMLIVPTEQSLFDQSFQRSESYDGSRPLSLPKLNLQYLSVGDFLWRALILYRRESFYGIRKDVDSAMRRLKPELGREGGTHFSGFSRMAMPISNPS
jgi:intron-binding protein aquarius